MIAPLPTLLPAHPLLEDETQIWLLDTRTLPEAAYRDAEVIMSDDEKASAARRIRGQQEYIASRWLVRRVLALHTGLHADAIYCRRNSKGKPSIDGIEFNLSHSGPYAVLAVHRSSPVGVDIEAMDTRRAPLDIAHHYFHPSEVVALAALTPEQQIPYFYHLWTLKEATLKALGLGIATGLDQVVVTRAPSDIHFGEALTSYANQPWHYLTWALDDTYLCSLAMATKSAPTVTWVDAESLLSESFT